MDKINKYVQNLPDSIRDSLEWYTGGNFDTLNSKLRKNKQLNSVQKANFNNIQVAFNGVPKLNRNIRVYKGKSSENVYSDKAFISTSLSVDGAYEFSGDDCCILVIDVMTGSKILPLSELSRYKDEQEILLDRNATLTITNMFEKNDMKFINCVYTNGVILQQEKDIKKIEKIMIKEDNETDVINRLFTFFEDDDPDFYDEDDVINFYNKIYPMKTIDKKILEKVLNMLHS